MVLFNLGRTLERIPGREGEARAAYQRVIGESPATPEFENTIAMATVGLRELDARTGGRGSAGSGNAGVSPVGPIVLAVGGAAAVAGLVLGGLALAREGDLSARCPDDVCADSAENRSLHDEMVLLAGLSDGFVIGGVAVAAAGLVLTLVLVEESDSAVEAACTPSGCGVALRGSF